MLAGGGGETVNRYVHGIEYIVEPQEAIVSVESNDSVCIVEEQQVIVCVIGIAPTVLASGVVGPYFREFTNEFTNEFT